MTVDEFINNLNELKKSNVIDGNTPIVKRSSSSEINNIYTCVNCTKCGRIFL